MQERRLRPGDALDDYCPRERRITDHAVVAMIDDTIKQTRCASCDTEHVYKHARIPAQRRKKADAALFTQVLDGLTPPSARIASRLDDEPDAAPGGDAAGEPDTVAETPAATPHAAAPAEPETRAAAPADDVASADAPAVDEAESTDTPPIDEFPDEGPVRRRLFRAQLPRHEGQQALTRTLPDFTVRQPGSGRAARPGGQGQGQGQGAGHGRRRSGGGQQGGGGQTRFGRGGHGPGGGRGPGGFGQGQGQGPGQGQGQGQGRRRRGKKKP